MFLTANCDLTHGFCARQSTPYSMGDWEVPLKVGLTQCGWCRRKALAFSSHPARQYARVPRATFSGDHQVIYAF